MKSTFHIQRNTQTHWVGDGFPVRTLFSYQDDPALFSPFLMLEHAGPTAFEPTAERRGVGAHPHRGFEAVTIVLDGEVSHRDSTGALGSVGPGDVQWMTAGAGIVHEEFHSEAFARSGGPFHMVQLWVNLPARDKMTAPGYQSIGVAQIPTVPLPDGAGTLRLIAGSWLGAQGPARTFTPIQVGDVRLQAGHSVTLPVLDGHTALALVLQGRVKTADGAQADASELIGWRREGAGVMLGAVTDARVLWLAGEPIDEPVLGHGPFVMNSQAQIRQALADYQSGRMGRLD